MTVKPFSRLNYAARNYNVVSAVMVPVYSVSASSSSINEGTAVTYTITTQYVLDGTILYWTTSGITTAADFTDGLTSGSVTMTNNTATVTRTLVSDITTEGAETIVFELRTGSTSGTIVASTPSGTVNDTSILTITPNVSSMNEGATVTWTINAIGFGTGTLYWTNSGTTTGSDFSDGLNSGSIAITADSGTLSKTLINDLSTEGSETIIIQIRTGSTSGTIVGTSSTVTVADTSVSLQAYSMKFVAASTQYLTVPTSSFLTATNTYTIEMWLNPTSYPGAGISAALYQVSNATVSNFGALVLTFFGSGTIRLDVRPSTGGTNVQLNSASVIPLNTWTHVAVVVNAGAATIYLNGVSSATGSVVVMDGTQTFCSIGRLNNGYTSSQTYYNGFISNFRILKNVAQYTAAFTPPTDNLPAISGTSLLLSGPTIADSSGNSLSITNNGTTITTMENPFGDYSTYFPSGAGSNYVVPHSSSLDFGTGDFTIEFWMYATNIVNTSGIIGKKADDTTNGWQIYYNSTYATNRMSIRLGLTNDFTSTSSWTLNVWDHWAVTRSGTTVSWFKNGVLDATGTNSSDISEVRSVYIGYSETWGGYFTGYLSNIRVVKGTALYPWIPATTALTTTSQNATASQVSLLTAQSATIIDNGNGGPGQPTYITGTPYITLLNGTSQYVTTPTNAALSFTGDFTVEGWFYFKSVTQGTLFHIGTETTNRFAIFLSNGGIQGNWYTGVSLSLGGSLSVGVWYHIAFTRVGTTIRCYINGTATGSTINQGGTLGDGKFSIGYEPTNSGSPYLSAYVTNVRAVKGVVVYTGTFTPSGPLTATQSSGTNIAAITGTSTSLLTLQDATFVDNSTNAFTITTGGSPTLTNLVNNLPITNTGTVTAGNSVIPFASTYSYQFNGSSQYLTVPANAAFAFGTGDFTVECWVYITTALTGGALIGPWTGTASTSAWIFTQGNAATSYLRFGVSNGSTTTFFEGTGGLTTNQWIHVAAVRTAGTIKLYSNGVQVYSGAATQNISVSSQALQINGVSGATFLTTGYMSNIRVVKGSALYSSNFIPSTSALTAISGTSLLTCQYSEIMDGSTNHATITAVVPRPNNQNPFGNYYVAINSATSQNLNTSSSNTLAFGTGDFTVEFWVYWISSPGVTGNLMQTNVSGTGFCMYWNSTQVQVSRYLTAADLNITYSETAQNTWIHYAAVRRSGTMYVYRNGVLLGSGAVSTSYTQNGFYLTSDNTNTNFNGYITNVRVVKGLGVYTGAFTPPTTPLTVTQSAGTNIAAITGTSTSLLFCQYANFVDSSTNSLAITNSNSVKSYLTDNFSGIVSGVNYAQKNYSLKILPSSVAVTYLSGTLPATLSGDFTVECWFNMDYTLGSPPTMNQTSIAATGATVGGAFTIAGNGVSSSTGWCINLWLDGISWVRPGSATNFEFVPSGATYGSRFFLPNTWYHLAICRIGTTWYCYINGVLATNRTATNYSITTTAVVIGDIFAQTQWNFWGYISNFRIVNGLAVYTGAFTPSTTPLKAAQSSGTNIAAITTQTNILTCQYNTLFDASNNKIALTKVGSPDMVNVYPFPT